mgnify:CR=1 FL=1
MIIVATPGGIEIDGILLKNTVEMQAYISAHRPQDLEVVMNPVPPHDLRAPIGVHPPMDLLAKIGAVPPKDLSVYFGIIRFFDFQARIGTVVPMDLHVELGITEPVDIRVDIGAHSPIDLEANIFPVPYHKLEVTFWSVHHAYLYAIIGSSVPHDLDVLMNIYQRHDLRVPIKLHSPKDLVMYFRIFQRTTNDLVVYVHPVHSGYSNLSVDIFGWAIKYLYVPIGGHPGHDLYAQIYGWRFHDLDAAIEATSPQDLPVVFEAAAEPGYDLIVIHRTFQTHHLLVDFNIWRGIQTLPVYLHGVYAYDLSVMFTMGGHHDFTINLPMTTGYKDLFVTLKPASRVMTTIIPILTMEIHDLYVSINQGWPCGFGSSYKNLEVTFNPSFLLSLEVLLRCIDGSGTSVIGSYINRHNFSSFLNTYPLEFYLPESTGEVQVNILDKIPVTYKNEFDDIAEEIIQLRFSWPRTRIYSGELNLSVDIFAYRQDPYYDLRIYLEAIRPDVPKMPTSQPLVQRTQSWEEPVWPAVFQVKELELWAEDPPEVVRVIEVVFGEQIHEYYWLSNEQRAYRKEDYEEWTMMTRGYLPHAEYSGQIDYVSLYEISDMKNYETIDAAFRALISSFTHKGQYKLQIDLRATGSYHDFKVFMDVWGSDRFYNLSVIVEPSHLHDLEVEFTCVP